MVAWSGRFNHRPVRAGTLTHNGAGRKICIRSQLDQSSIRMGLRRFHEGALTVRINQKLILIRYLVVLSTAGLGLAGCESGYPHEGPALGYSDVNKSGPGTYGGTSSVEGPKDPAGKLAPEIKNATGADVNLRAPSGQGGTNPGTGTYGGSSGGGSMGGGTTPGGPTGSNPGSGNSR